MKLFRIAAVGTVALLAWGCLLTPGKFDASLDLRRDGRFTYRYTGEMVFVTPGSAMADVAGSDDDKFDPDAQICSGESSDDEDAIDIRDCTPAEIEQKRKEHEEGREARVAEKKKNAEMMKAMMGGIDTADPKTMDEFGRRLQGHAGWKRVQHKGHGVFDVDYELSGRLDHDLVFPVFPDVDFVIPFVKVVRLTGNRVRVVAPAFVQSQDNSFKALGAAMQSQKGAGEALMRKPEGNFTITSDAEVLTNNTRDGPSRVATGRLLRWNVGPLDTARPEALFQF